ncbi:MAG: NAD(P)/FAD-dependent oxidoreductase [Oscillospiraceae bacterium]|jgi:2,4-dienoyl-CoA reductase-like NADH-dependent reductase (Old Yellow Enzyme family)/thioredoxin reductase|nr:NAD(P)/FAD-dependent oxidoreductase [Oscillospiraceae bacterium]
MKYPHLFSPIRLGNTLFRNRIFGAPTGYQMLTAEGYPTDAATAYYSRKAQGGAASVAIGECLVDSHYGKGGMKHIYLDDTDGYGNLAALTEGIYKYGAVAVAELQHPGMYAEGGGRGVGMTDGEIEETIEAFANAAVYAKKCGFGMAMIHGGHGWLMSQFLSPQINTRDDRWGGSLENRVRFPIAVCDRIKVKCGKDYPVEFRMSVTESNPDGYGMDEGVKIAIALDGHVDLIHCSAGNHEVRDAFVVTHPSMFLPDGANAYLAAEVKKYVKTPVATVGAFTEPELMEELIASGKADVIEVARELLADPDMPIKARSGREGDITKCMRCFTCFSNLINNRQFCCAVNPEIGIEREITALPDAKMSKTVLVAGGGVAGMQVALTAAQRGHNVILCEKSDKLGGVLRCEEDVPFKQKLSEYLNLQAKRVAQAGVDIHLNTEVTADLARRLAPDVIIAALGARPVTPKIPGIENAVGAEAVYVDTSKAGKRVAILGGGLVGTELAIFLGGQGREVTIIEMQPTLSDGGNMLHSIALEVQLREKNVALSLGTKALQIEKNGVKCELPNGETKFFDADTVIYAVGQAPLWDDADEMRFIAPEFHQIGDGLSPKNIHAATRAAYFTAVNIGRI